MEFHPGLFYASGACALFTAPTSARFYAPTPANGFILSPHSAPRLAPFLPLKLLRVAMRPLPPMAFLRCPPSLPGLTPSLPLLLQRVSMRSLPPIAFLSVIPSSARNLLITAWLAHTTLSAVQPGQLPTPEILRSSFAYALNDRACALFSAHGDRFAAYFFRPPAAFLLIHTFFPGACALFTDQTPAHCHAPTPANGSSVCHSEQREESLDAFLVPHVLQPYSSSAAFLPTHEILRSALRPPSE